MLGQALLAVLWLVAGIDARSLSGSKTIRSKANIVSQAPPIPTSTLITDFQKNGVNSTWADGHPKAWGSEAVKFKGPAVADVSPDEKFVVLVSGSNVTIRDLNTLELVSSTRIEFEGDADSVTIIPSPDGGYDLFVASLNYSTYNAITRLHLLPTGIDDGKQTQYQGTFSSFDGRRGPFSADGRRFLFKDNDRLSGRVIINDLDNPEVNVTLVGHTNPVMSAAFSPDGTLVSTAAWDGYGKVWNASTGELLHNFGPSGAQNWKTNFSPDGKYVLVTNAGKNAAVNIWPVSNMSAAPITITNFGNWPRTASWTSDGKFLAAGTYGIIQVFSMDEGKVVQRWEMEDHINFESWDLFWIEGEESGLKLAYRTTAGLEVYDFETNLKYRWGPDAYAQYDGGGSGSGTCLIKSRGWIGGRDADLSIRFYEFPI